MTTSENTPYYRPLDTALLRASMHPGGMDLPPWPGDTAGAGPWRTWLAKVWAMRPVAEAVALASPVLADQVETMLAGRQPGTGQARRMAMTLARYLVRMRGRATPFGTFAGVSPASFGPHPVLRVSEDHRVRTRADAVWLADVTARLEARLPLLLRLPVQVNDLAVERGGRLVVPWQPHLSTPSRGHGSEVEVSVRLVPVVQTVRHAARSPIRAHDLVDKVAADHPGAAREALEAVVGQLVAAGVLISGLRAPSTATDALAHLLNQLRKAGADDLPETGDLVRELRVIHARLTALGDAGAWRRHRGWRVTDQRMREISPAVDQPLTVDLRLGGTLVLPYEVADEAAAAAEALIRLSLIPTASESWREYHRSFLGRYGPGTLVPVADLADPVAGLGFPRHFTPPSPGGRAVTLRDEALLALAQQAVLDGADEIVLDAAALDAFASASAEMRRPVSPVDLWVDLRADTPEAVTEGAFTLGVCGFGRIAANTGRFLDLLDEADRQRMTGLYGRLPPGVDGALAAQLSFPPRHPRLENVLRVPPVLPHVIPLGEHRDVADEHIPVEDLAIVADATRLYVVSRSMRRVVEPMLPHAGARHTMPPLARLLFEIPRSIHPAVTPFDWGTAACLPHLPRVRHGRSILAPAQWRLTPADLPGPETPMSVWSAALEAVRAQRHLPAGLAVGGGDRRLRLDLDEAMDRSVLRAHLQAADGPVTVTEAPTTADHAWFGGRAHEVFIPLAATAPPDPAAVFLTGSAPLPVTDRDHGTGVVFVKLYGIPEVFDTLLTAHMPTLLQRWETPPRWWFVRYRHPARTCGSACTTRTMNAPPDTWRPGRKGCGSRDWPGRSPSTPTGRRPGGTGPGRPWQLRTSCSPPTPRPPCPARLPLRQSRDPPAGTDRREPGRPGERHDRRPDIGDALADRPPRVRGRRHRAGPRRTAPDAPPRRRREAARRPRRGGRRRRLVGPRHGGIPLQGPPHPRDHPPHAGGRARLAAAPAPRPRPGHRPAGRSDDVQARAGRRIGPHRPPDQRRRRGPVTVLKDSGLREAAAAVADELAAALAVPPPVDYGDDYRPDSPRWRDQSLSKGAAGVAVLHGLRAQCGLGGEEAMRAWLARATRDDLSAGPGAGLWFGAPAVAFALSTAAPGRYPAAMASLDTAAADLTETRLKAAHDRMDAERRPALYEFDLVRGLTGLGAYLLHRDPGGDLVRRVLSYLVRLTKPVPAGDAAGSSAPGWWTAEVLSKEDDPAFAAGQADFGAAHGITGPLALMAISIRDGVMVDGHREAIETICHWLDSWRQQAPAGPWWPERITLAELRDGRPHRDGPARPSWCYGTPGLARAQQLAALATGDTARQHAAEDALIRCLDDPVQLARITDPALCHGWAGVLATAWHAAADAATPALTDRLPGLLGALLDHARDSPPDTLPGLVEGSAGIALTLHSIATGRAGGWQSCLLLN